MRCARVVLSTLAASLYRVRWDALRAIPCDSVCMSIQKKGAKKGSGGGVKAMIEKKKQRAAQRARAAEAAGAANEVDEGDGGDEREPSSPLLSPAPAPAPAPMGDAGGADYFEPIAPLWDMPEEKVRIPVSVLSYTIVYRLVFDEGRGEEKRAHCGNLPPQAGPSDLKRQFGGGKFFLQARIGQRVAAGRVFVIDGPSANTNLPFGPVGELPSGLVTLTQTDPTLAGFFAMFQMNTAQMRDDFQRVLQMMFELNKSLATQYGAANVASHLRDDNAAQRQRIKELEEKLEARAKDHTEFELEKLKFKLKKEPEWKELVSEVGSMVPAVVERLPPRVKAFLEGLVPDGEAPAAQLPAGVKEHP